LNKTRVRFDGVERREAYSFDALYDAHASEEFGWGGVFIVVLAHTFPFRVQSLESKCGEIIGDDTRIKPARPLLVDGGEIVI
jgi:hypothetical protein